MKRVELFGGVALALMCVAVIVISFRARTVHAPPAATPTIYGRPVGAQSITCSTIVLTDADGKATLTIQAGPPATMEIRLKNGRTKILDLQELAGNRWLGE